MQKKFSAFRYFESRLPDGKNSLPEVPVPAVGVSQELNKMITPTGTVSHGERPQGEFLNEIQNQQKHAASVEASVNAQINNPQTPSTLRTELVQTQNAYQADKQANTQRTKEVLLKNSDVKFEFDNKGNITVDSLRSLFGDLDRRGGVEVTNVGRFRKLFNGGKEQKFIIGEAQLQENLKDFTDVVQLEDVYRRVTGDMGGLNISKSDYYRQEEIKSGQNRGDVVDVEALLPEKLKKVKNFQTALLEKTAMVAGLMGVLFGDADQRAGLNMVLTGNVDKINNLLLSPEGQKKALEYVQKSETLSREPGLGYKIANALLKIGINFPIALMTKGIVSANFENSDLKIVHPETTAGSESEKRQNLVKDSVSNLSLDKQVGENGSIAANLDIVGARFEVNWNDPKSTINSALNKYVQASDKNAAINEIIQALNSKGVSGIREKTKQNNEDQAKILSEQFKQMHAEFILLYTQMQAKNPNDPRLAEMRKALQTEVSSYVGKMMELRGTKLQGAFANFGLGWLSLGLSFANVKNFATFDGVKTGAAHLEADLTKREISGEALNRALLDAWIKQNSDGSYTLENGTRIQVPDGQKVIWDLKKIITDKSYYYEVGHKFVAKSSPEQSKTITIRMDNKELKNSVIEDNSKLIADTLWKWRTPEVGKKGKISSQEKQQQEVAIAFQKAASSGDVATAEVNARKIFANIPAVISAIDWLKENQEKADFYKLLLAKSSGGKMSREIASAINNLPGTPKNLDTWDEQKKAILNYYDKHVAKPFATQYGISEDFVKKQAEKMLANNKVANLKDTFLESNSTFTAIVAFNQSNWWFKKLDQITYGNAQTFGEVLKVEDPNVVEKVKTQIKATITDNQRDHVRRQLAIGYGHMVDAQGNPTQEVIAKNPQIYGKDVIDNLIVAGPVKSYLSFESNAECFNLGFTVEPGMVSWKIPGVESNEQSVAGTGVVIGRDVMMKNEVGLGMGIKKQKEPDTPTTEPKQEQADASTTVASGATEKVSDIADIPVVKSWVTYTPAVPSGQSAVHFKEFIEGATPSQGSSQALKNLQNTVRKF